MFGVIVAGALPFRLAEDQNWFHEAKIALGFIILVVGPPLAVAALAAALPRRNARRAGARSSRFLYSNAARWLERGLACSGGVILLISVIGFWLFPSFRAHISFNMIKLGIGLLGMPALFAYYRMRASAPSLEASIEQDRRPPVLYLRAFYQEADAFTWGPKGQMASHTEIPIMSQTWQTWNTISVTFEQYLGLTLAREIGLFVALGNPEDVLPPEGAARRYAADREWQQGFLDLAESAAAIVMEISRSDNLQWEIAALRRHSWQRKLFVITPPLPKSNRAAGWLYAIVRAAKALPPPDWAEFAAELAHAGFRLNLVDPGPGSVISFDVAGRAEVIIRGAVEPADFIRAIATRLETLTLPSNYSEAPGIAAQNGNANS